MPDLSDDLKAKLVELKTKAVATLKSNLGPLFDNLQKDSGPFLEQLGADLATQGLRYAMAATEGERAIAEHNLAVLAGGAHLEASLAGLKFVRAAEAAAAEAMQSALGIAGDLLKMAASALLKIPIP